MNRTAAIKRLNMLKGNILQDMATQYGVTIYTPRGTVNKGWAGHVCESYLGLPINSSQSPDFGNWELKSIPLKVLKSGKLSFKETMAVTMIDPQDILDNEFSNSHLLTKLQKLVVVARIVGKDLQSPSVIHSATSFDLEGEMYDMVKNDYDTIRDVIKTKGFSSLSGRLGKFIQARTKGAGHGSTSRAFYARPIFLSQFINL